MATDHYLSIDSKPIDCLTETWPVESTHDIFFSGTQFTVVLRFHRVSETTAGFFSTIRSLGLLYEVGLSVCSFDKHGKNQLNGLIWYYRVTNKFSEKIFSKTFAQKVSYKSIEQRDRLSNQTAHRILRKINRSGKND